jgi:predicted small secreted protein
MKRIAAWMLVLWAMALAGCNTVQGIGKDVEKAGEAIQRTTR